MLGTEQGLSLEPNPKHRTWTVKVVPRRETKKMHGGQEKQQECEKLKSNEEEKIE